MKQYRNLLCLFICFAIYASILVSCGTNNTVDGKIISYETLQAYETPISVYRFQGQVIDNYLMLSAKLISPSCKDINDTIKIKLRFQNLTNEPITITSEFNIISGGLGAGGNITALISDSDENRIYTLADVNLSSDTFYVYPNIFSTIPSKSFTEFIIDYEFPKRVYANLTDEVRSVTSPGNYLIRFVYSDYLRENNNWEGTISSNDITVCIK